MSQLFPNFDFKNPDYGPVMEWRNRHLLSAARKPEVWAGMKLWYRDHWADFAEQWVMTYDPRRIPSLIPMVLFPRQREYLDWLYARYKNREDGIMVKSRDVGATWLNVVAAICLFLFQPGAKVAFGSRKEDLVDKLGDPDSILEKARIVLRYLPAQLLPDGFDINKHCGFLRFVHPDGQASITGESGDNIGRGGRNSLYVIDEAAHIDRPELVEAALSMNSDCKIYVSTPNGTGNPFEHKWLTFPEERKFLFGWQQDPRKDDAWYAKMCNDHDPWIVAQEIDHDFAASIENVCIPALWVRSAVGLKLEASGNCVAGFDAADEGKDPKALVIRRGPVVELVESWTDGDIASATRKAWAMARAHGVDLLCYDNIGIGAGAKVEFSHLQRQSRANEALVQGVGSERLTGVYEGNKPNREMFHNYRAMAWWNMRRRFERTHQHVTGVRTWPDDELISIPNHPGLIAELSRPTYMIRDTGKLAIESKTDMRKRGVPSPNLADALILAFTPSSHVAAGKFGGQIADMCAIYAIGAAV